MRILPTLSFCWSSLAEMATELKKQKPLGTGGRVSAEGPPGHPC